MPNVRLIIFVRILTLLFICLVSAATTDYVSLNTSMTITGPKKCFSVNLINDNVGEVVETFQVFLRTNSLADEVTFINRSLTVVIIDDGKLNLCMYV